MSNHKAKVSFENMASVSSPTSSSYEDVLVEETKRDILSLGYRNIDAAIAKVTEFSEKHPLKAEYALDALGTVYGI